MSSIRFALAAAGALLLIVTLTPVVRWAAVRLSCDWTDADSDVLIVLGGGTIAYPGYPSGMIIGEDTYGRALAAVHAWRTGRFRRLVVCGEGMEETVKPFLIAQGVPGEAILVENRSRSTRENALFAKPILSRLNGRFVLLTSDFHMYRAARCFARAGIPVATRPFPDVSKRARRWSYRWEGFWTLVTELGKIAYYRARGWI